MIARTAEAMRALATGVLLRDTKSQDYLGMGWRWYPFIADARVFHDPRALEKALDCLTQALEPVEVEAVWMGDEIVPGVRSGDLIGGFARPVEGPTTVTLGLTDFHKQWFEVLYPSRFIREPLEL